MARWPMLALVMATMAAVGSCGRADAAAGRAATSLVSALAVPAEYESALYSLLDTHGIGADKFADINLLLKALERNVHDEIAALKKNFTSTKNADELAVTEEIEKDYKDKMDLPLKKQAAAHKAVVEADAAVNAATKAFLKAEKLQARALKQQNDAQVAQSKRAKQLIAQNDKVKADAINTAQEEEQMVSKVSALIKSVKSTGLLCELCGKGDELSKKERLEQMKRTQREALEKKYGPLVCNETLSAQVGIAFVACLKSSVEEEDKGPNHHMCKRCDSQYEMAHHSTISCADNHKFMEGPYMKELKIFNELWHEKCPRPCQCTQEFEPVCGVDGSTYSNHCRATCVNVLVKHVGACDRPTVPQSMTNYTKAADGASSAEIVAAQKEQNANASHITMARLDNIRNASASTAKTMM